MQIRSLGVVATLAIALVACTHQNEIHYRDDHTSLEAFTADMARGLQAGADKYTSALHTKKNVSNGVSLLQTEIVPRAGINAIVHSYRNYCEGQGGTFDQLYCYNGAENTPLFYIALESNGTYAGYPIVIIRAFEPAGNPDQVLAVAQQYGYKTRMQRLEQAGRQAQAQQRRDDLRAQRLADQQRQAADALARAQRLSIETRDTVKQRGTRVCSVNNAGKDACMRITPCYTEDYNPENGKIKVAIGQHLLWSDIADWYACGH